MLKFRNLILIFCAIAMLLLCSCHDHGERFEENPFPDYQVYDYHLRYLRTAKKHGEWRAEQHFLEYYQIDGPDESQYIGLHGGPFFGLSGDYILQHSQDSTDILRQWTVTSVEFFIPPMGTRGRFYRYRFGRAVDYMEPHYQGNSQALYEELLLLIDAPEKVPSKSLHEYDEDLFEAYWVSEADSELVDILNTGALYMRINFAESDAIVWETRFSLQGDPHREKYISMDFGTTMTDYAPNHEYCLIARDSAIYRAVIAALEAYATQ